MYSYLLFPRYGTPLPLEGLHPLLQNPLLSLSPGNRRGNPFPDNLLPLSQCFPESFHGQFAILRLGSPFARLNDDAGGDVTNPDRGIRYIPVLPSRTGTPEKLDPDVGFLQFHIRFVPKLNSLQEVYCIATNPSFARHLRWFPPEGDASPKRRHPFVSEFFPGVYLYD